MADAEFRHVLSGRRVLVVRPAAQGLASAEILRAAGAVPVQAPLIELSPPADGGAALAAALRRLGDYDWLVLTSANGAERFMDALGDGQLPPIMRVAAIGPATATTLATAGVAVSLLPDRYVAEALVDAFPARHSEGPSRSPLRSRTVPSTGAVLATGGASAATDCDSSPAEAAADPGASGRDAPHPSPDRHGAGRVLVVRAAVARDVLPDGLRAKGWSVDVVAAYRAEPRILPPAERAAVATCDTVIFTSPSVVDAFCDQPEPLPVPPTVAAIGPVTAEAARRRGLPVHVEATEHTVAGVVAALAGHASAPSVDR